MAQYDEAELMLDVLDRIGDHGFPNWASEAAALIRTQSARIAELEAERDTAARDYCNLMDRHDAHFVAWQSAKARAEAAEAKVARLREALTLIERLYYIEDKSAKWRASRMNGVAREAQDGNDLGHYRRIFPSAVPQRKSGE